MNKTTLAALVPAVIAVLSNVYWRRRERIVRESLTTSRELEERGDFDRSELATAREAASTLNTRPEDLPEKVEQLDEKIRVLHAELEDSRDRWARAWWDARRLSPVRPDEPSVVVATIPDGELSDVEALAQLLSEKEHGIALLAGGGDGSFGVVVDDRLTDEVSAAALANEIGELAGGGGGGSDHYAIGGGATGDLDEAVTSVRERLERTMTVS